MCCNGVMFHYVRLQPADSPKALAALGLKLKRKRRQDCILQPCPAHRDACCSIYESRPERCRVFACRQLEQLAAGTIPETAAQEKITQAVTLVAEVESLLQQCGAMNAKHPLSKRCETAMAEPLDASADAAVTRTRDQLSHAMQKLDAMLDRDFRITPAEPAD